MILRQDKYDEAHSDKPEQRQSLFCSSLSPSAVRFWSRFRSAAISALRISACGELLPVRERKVFRFALSARSRAALWVSWATELDRGSDSDARGSHPSAESTRIDLIHWNYSNRVSDSLWIDENGPRLRTKRDKIEFECVKMKTILILLLIREFHGS